MKRAFAILFAVVFALSSAFSASAAAQPQAQNRLVYVASQPIPKAAAAAARDWFSGPTAAQEIRDFTKFIAGQVKDATGLTAEQVKTVKLCRAYRVEFFGAETLELYHFPLLYEDTFIATYSVLWYPPASRYNCSLGGGDAFLESLNTLSSSPSAPLTFIHSKENFFVKDSKNKVNLVWASYPDQKERIEQQMRDIQKMARPSKVTAIGAATAYPEQVSSMQIATEEPVLVVKDETNKLIYKSDDGGKTWRNNAKPMMHVSIEKTVFPKEDGKILYTVHNNTKGEQGTGVYFDLQKWNGQKWVKIPEIGDIMFPDVAIMLAPNSSESISATWGGSINLKAGQYKLIKKLAAEGRQFTCEVEFVLE